MALLVLAPACAQRLLRVDLRDRGLRAYDATEFNPAHQTEWCWTLYTPDPAAVSARAAALLRGGPIAVRILSRAGPMGVAPEVTTP